jgi:hypothetical protein
MATPFPQSRGFLPFDNPVSQWVEPRRNALMGLSAGFLSGDPSRAFSGAMQGAQLDQQYMQDQQAFAQQAEETNATKEWLRQRGREDLIPLVDAGQGTFALQEATKVADPGAGLMSVGGSLYNPADGSWITPPAGSGNDPRVSLSGQWGFDETTQQPVYLQPSDSGAMVQATTPPGVRLLGPYDLNAERAAGSTFGKGTGSAQFDLPAAALTTQQTLQAIQSVRDQSKGMEEQFGNILGVPQQMLPTMPQSERANFQIETNRLINRTFLEAREVLRGGGQITDFESRKAEGAISNLEEAMARGDKALFEKSLTELEQAVSDGYAKLQAQAGAIGGYGQAPRPQQNSGTTSSGVPWSIGQ